MSNENRRKEILDAAAKSFREKGYKETSMRGIAALVDMKAGSLYYHFISKEDLLVAVHEEGMRKITKEVKDAIGDKQDPWDRMEAAVIAHLNCLLDPGDYAQVVIRAIPREDSPMRRRLAALRDNYEGILKELIIALPLSANKDKHYFNLLLLGALNWTHSWFKPEKGNSAEIGRKFIEILKS